MVDSQLDNFDASHEVLMREYLSRQLDPQLGGAELRFRQFLDQEQLPPRQTNMFRLPVRFSRWTFGIVGAALAASLAGLWAGPSLKQEGRHQAAPAVSPSTAVNNPIVVEQDVQSQMYDDGAIMMDGDTPVRVLRRRDVEHMRWFDAQKKLEGEQVVPQDHLVYVKLKTY